MKTCLPLLLILFNVLPVPTSAVPADEDGYRLWLRYERLPAEVASKYAEYLRAIVMLSPDDRITNAAGELAEGIPGLLGRNVSTSTEPATPGAVILGTLDHPWMQAQFEQEEINNLTREGYFLSARETGNGRVILVAGKESVGVLYGVFELLRLIQTGQPLDALDLAANPAFEERIFNHWDNVFVGTVERGYAGSSIFIWRALEASAKRHRDYARMAASIGINGTVINNVNTSTQEGHTWELLKSEHLPEVALLADRLRPWGIRLYLSVNFASPVMIGGLATADPLDGGVIEWWEGKAAEIYSLIPDFGGFLVKANSEGEPGPQDYGRTHAQGANLLANVLAPYGGWVHWRAFVYGTGMTAFEMFQPLDSKFADNASVQIKYGPVDFQVREPVHPLFGGMPQTNQMLELQITQEYTGQQNHLVYLAPYWKEILDFDTYANGPGSRVSNLLGNRIGNGIAGVANIGSYTNWTGHHLAAANTYAFGRLCWDPELDPADIATEWTRMTFGFDPVVESELVDMLMQSHRVFEDYTSPLGIGFLSDYGHYDPGLEIRQKFHKADADSIGRGLTGEAAFYNQPNASLFANRDTCPEELLLYFHHVPYTYELSSGKTVLQHIYETHLDGVYEALLFRKRWDALAGRIDNARHKHVANRLNIQWAHAQVWRDAVNGFLQTKSNSAPVLDRDGDPLDDIWERVYLGSLDYGPMEDPLGVGRPLLLAYAFDLDPFKPDGSVIELDLYTDSMTVSFSRQANSGLNYAIEVLDGSGGWMPAATMDPVSGTWSINDGLILDESPGIGNIRVFAEFSGVSAFPRRLVRVLAK